MENHTIQSLFSVTEVELIYRNKVDPFDRPTVTSSNHAYDVLINAWDMNRIELVEEFYILLLDRNNHCLGLSRVSQGGISSCLIDPKIVFATSLKSRASGIVLAHNHPSGNLQPSKADIDLTHKLKAGGKLLEIGVMDHLIVTPHRYLSFADEGLMPT